MWFTNSFREEFKVDDTFNKSLNALGSWDDYSEEQIHKTE